MSFYPVLAPVEAQLGMWGRPFVITKLAGQLIRFPSEIRDPLPSAYLLALGAAILSSLAWRNGALKIFV